ncbi:MAG: SGNH/GDSL hydrolase family protein [Eubacteriales bacterium]|nr:SGNH/GDSL hydrolase family protein [Eubacteriales bacterium]
MKEKRKRYSVYGDSISTFAGISPAGGVFYDGWDGSRSGVLCPEDTWWMQVILASGGLLGSNNSYSGSMVSGGELLSGTSWERLRALGERGTPDVILVNMGANDWGFGIPPTEFEYEYRRMLQRMKKLYPEAVIYCATLAEGEKPEDEIAFFNAEGVLSRRIYSEKICKVSGEENVRLADIAKYGRSYGTIDGIHPNKRGMKTLADLWLREMREDRRL